MDIYILNEALEQIGIIDEYESLIWTRRYYAAGDFELYLPASAAALDLLRVDRYLQREGDAGAMIIETIEVQTDAEIGDHIIVSGRSLESILARRIVWTQTNLTGSTETAIRRVITENCINPAQEGRAISRLQLAAANGFSETIEQQITGDNIAAWLETVCTAYGYGWKISIDGDYFVFYLYKGTDRSFDNAGGNPVVVFSPEFDNLLNTNYKFDKQNYCNAALIHGEGEGTARSAVSIGSAADLDRYEIYVDARDISTNEGEITATEYAAMLAERGAQKIAEQPIVTGYEGEVIPDVMYTLGDDYDLGDIVQIENEYGIAAKSRIIEIIETHDAEGVKIVPTFEEWEV